MIRAAWQHVVDLLERIPYSAIALLARFSIAGVFWLSGQTKVEGFAFDPFGWNFAFGLPHLSDNAVALFTDEYRLPLIDPKIAAVAAAIAEHLFSTMLLLGLGTRVAALALFGMTLVIEVFVYPGAWPTHGTWAAILLLLASRGPGAWSLDRWIATRARAVPSIGQAHATSRA